MIDFKSLTELLPQFQIGALTTCRRATAIDKTTVEGETCLEMSKGCVVTAGTGGPELEETFGCPNTQETNDHEVSPPNQPGPRTGTGSKSDSCLVWVKLISKLMSLATDNPGPLLG